MTTLELEQDPKVVRIDVEEDRLTVHLADGRSLSVPLAWYPRLAHATPEECQRYELRGGGHGIHWPDLDEDLSIENLLEGRRSGESEASFQRWLDERKRSRKKS